MKNYPEKLWGAGYTIRCGEVNSTWGNSYQLCAKKNKAGKVVFRRAYNYQKGQDTPWVRCINLDEANKLINYLKSNEPIIAQDGLTPVKSGATKVLNFIGTVTDTFTKEDLPIYVSNGGYDRTDATHSLDPKSGKIIKNSLVSSSFPNIAKDNQLNNTGVNIFEISDEVDLKNRIKKKIKKENITALGFFRDIEKQIIDNMPNLGMSPRDKWDQIVYKDKDFFVQISPSSSVYLDMNTSGTLSASLCVKSDLTNSMSKEEFSAIVKDLEKYVYDNFKISINAYSYMPMIRLEYKLVYQKISDDILNKILSNITIDQDIDTAGFVKLFKDIKNQYLIELKKSVPINDISYELEIMIESLINISEEVVNNFAPETLVESSSNTFDRKTIDEYSRYKEATNEALHHMVTADIHFNVIPKCFDGNRSIIKLFSDDLKHDKTAPEDPRWLKIIYVSYNNRTTQDFLRELSSRDYNATLLDTKLDGYKDVIEVDISKLQYEEDSYVEELDYSLDEDYKWIFDTIRVHVIDTYKGSSWNQELEMVNNSINDTITSYRKTLGRGYRIEYIGPGKMHRNKAMTKDNDPDIDLIWTAKDGSKAYRVFTDAGFDKLNVKINKDLKIAFDNYEYIVLKETSGKIYLIELGSRAKSRRKAVYNILESNSNDLKPIVSEIITLITDKNLLDLLNAYSAEIYNPDNSKKNIIDLAEEFYLKFSSDSKLKAARSIILNLIDIDKDINPWDYDSTSEIIFVKMLVESENEVTDYLIDFKNYIENENHSLKKLLPKINNLIDIFDKELASYEFIESM